MPKSKPPRLPRRRTPGLLPDAERLRLQAEIVEDNAHMQHALAMFDLTNPSMPEVIASTAVSFGVSKEIAAQALQSFTRTIYLEKSKPAVNKLLDDARAQGQTK